MIVQWKLKRLLLATTGEFLKQKGKDIPKVGKTIKIIPGVNYILDEDWNEIKPSLTEHLNAKNLIEYVDKDGKVAKIDSLDIQVARDLISDCWQKDALEFLLGSTRNQELRIAIDDQQKELEYLVSKGTKSPKAKQKEAKE